MHSNLDMPTSQLSAKSNGSPEGLTSARLTSILLLAILVQWCGAGWVHYTVDSLPAVASGVTSLAFQGDTVVWAATGGSGVLRYDGTEWFLYSNIGSSLSHDIVHVVCVHEDLNGDIWFGTKQGVSVLRGGTTWEVYDIDDGMPANEVNSVTIDHNGDKWFGTSGGIVKYDDAVFTVYDADSGVTSDLINALAVDQSNDIWAASGDGVFMYNGSSWTRHGTGSGLPSVNVHDVCIDRDGQAWLATAAGVAVMNGGTVVNVIDNPVATDPNVFYTVRQDSAGFYWLGSYFSGLFRYDGTTLVQFDTTDGLIDNTVNAIAVNGSHVRCIGMASGLSIFWNSAPQITAVSDTSVVALDDLVIDISAADEDKEDSLIYELVDSPGTMQMNSGTGAIAWTPDLGDLGTDTIVVKVTDQYGSAAYDTFTVDVEPPLAAQGPATRAPHSAFVAVRANGTKSAAISFGTPSRARVRLDIVDMRGRRVQTLVSGLRDGGHYAIPWQSETPLPSGTYFCRFIAGSFARTVRLYTVN